MDNQVQALPSVPHYLLRNADELRDHVAMRHKELGIWRQWTWAQQLVEIRRFSLGLEQLGLQPGDKVAIIGHNCPKLYWTFAAAQAVGGVPVPVYANSVAEEMGYVLEHAGIRFAVCQDQEQVDKVLSLQDSLQSLEYLIYDEERGLRGYDTDRVLAFDFVQQLGDHATARDVGAVANWCDSIDTIDTDSLSVMLYTLGTTSKPKGVMLSHRNLIVTSLNANHFDSLTSREKTIAYLPLAWVGDHVFSYGQSYTAGYCVCCPESPDTVTSDRRKIAPSYFFAAPRVLEKWHTNFVVNREDAGRVRSMLFNYFIKVANKHGEKILNRESVSLMGRILYGLGNLFVYGPLKNQLGMGHVRVAYTAGEAIDPDIFRFYRSLGINLKQFYGQTEASGYITAQPDGQVHANTVGTASMGVEIAILDSGEVVYRSPGVFLGYYKNDRATLSTKTEGGWVHTGDAGFIDEAGQLRIIDRQIDLDDVKRRHAPTCAGESRR